MASKHIGSIAVGVEASYGSVSGGVPGALALASAFVSMELADRAQITPYGDTVATERMDARDGFYGLPPEAVVNATAGPMRRATITLDAWFRPIGGPGAIAAYAGHPLYRLLRTRFDEHLPAVGASDPVAAPLGTVNQFTPTVAGDYTIGEVLRLVTAAAPAMSRYTTVTDKTVAPLVICSPALDVAPPVGTIVYPLPTLHIPRNFYPTTFPTCALRINGANYQYECYGVVMTSLTITGVSDDGRAVRVSMELDAGWLVDKLDGYTPVDILPEVVAAGSICHSLAADAVISADVGTSAPAAVARTFTPCLDAWTLKVTWTMVYPGCGSSWLGRSTPEAVDMDVELEMVLSDYDASWELAGDFAARRQRTVLLGFSGGDGGPGEGGAICIPAAYQKVDGFKPTTDGDSLRQRLVYGAGRYSGDDDTTTLANSILRIAFG
jgi:hypothetical protein